MIYDTKKSVQDVFSKFKNMYMIFEIYHIM